MTPMIEKANAIVSSIYSEHDTVRFSMHSLR